MSVFDFISLFQKLWTKCLIKHVLLKRLCKLDLNNNKLHIETCCDFFIKYLYLKGNSKKPRLVFQENSCLEVKQISLWPQK